MLHQVNKLQVEIGCATEAQAFEVRHNLSQTCQQQVSAVIDKVCNKYVAQNEWIKIDSIEIDLGCFTMQLYQNNFEILLLEKFEKELTAKIKAIPATRKSASRQVAHLEMLIYFLQTGSLPWWAGNDAVDMDDIFEIVQLEQREQLYLFLQQQQFTGMIWQRIAMQFNKEVHRNIISSFPELQAAEKKIQQWVQLLSTPLKQIDIVSNINMAQWNKFILSNAPLFFYGLNKKISIDKMVQQFSIEYHAIEAEIVATVDLSKKILAYEANQTETIITDQVNEKMIATDVTVLAEEKFMVYTSGVVILAPYFKRFFTQLNLLEQGEWKNATAHYKAIQLVRYMATGHLMCPEHSLVLEKLLCGLEINIPIPKEVILSEKEKAEAILLLQAVIANWEQLKNTSVEGLRETFLKRDGILTKKENGWVLQVERKTVDILLDNIPWSFASLAFTWNNYIIFTTW